MNFANGYFWWIVLALPLAGYFLYFNLEQSRAIISRWFAASQVKNYRPLWKYSLLGGSFLFAVLSLLGPYFEQKMANVKVPEREIYFLLDLSASMNANDVRPTRLVAAKKLLKQMIQKMKGDKMGLIAFTNFAYVQCPATKDVQALELFVDLLETDQFGNTGTNLRKALQTAFDRFDANNPDKRGYQSRAVVLITDGENQSHTFYSILRQYKDKGISILPVGVGTTRGARVPLPHQDKDSSRMGGWVRDANGLPALSQLGDTTLRQIAQEFNFPYYAIENSSFDPEPLLETLNNLPVALVSKQEMATNLNLYQWFLFPAILMLGIALFLKPMKKEG